MKKTLKLAGLLLALVMVVSMMPIAAMAEDEDSYTITVNGAIDGKTYSAYKIFDIVSYQPAVEADEEADPPVAAADATAIYKVNSAFADLFAPGDPDAEPDPIPAGAGLTYFDISDDANEFVTPKDGADMQAFAKEALAFAKAKGITVAGSATAATDNNETPDDTSDDVTTATIEVSSLGYYLVDSVIGSLCALSSTVPDATVVEKNEVPTIAKTVEGAETTTASVGDVVEFQFVITIPSDTDWDASAGAESFVVTDTMESGLTYFTDTTRVLSVKGGTTELTPVAENVGDYTFATAGNGFTLTFTKAYLDTLVDGATITVTYYALVNPAAIADGSEVNTVTLAYGDSQSTSDTATVTTYGFDLAKIDGTSKAVIDGAEFELYDAATGGNKINLVYDETNGYYRPATATEAAATGFESAKIKANVARIEGLGNGDYYLAETKTPAGYNALTAREKVTINGADINFAASLALEDVTTDSTGGVLVANNQGNVLPETGGMGTTLFIVGGAVLMIAAGVLLIAKKRMAAK